MARNSEAAFSWTAMQTIRFNNIEALAQRRAEWPKWTTIDTKLPLYTIRHCGPNVTVQKHVYLPPCLRWEQG